MIQIEIEVLSEAINAPVIKMPGRKFPGIVIQGDTLFILYKMALRLSQLPNGEEASDLKREILSISSEWLQIYEETLLKHKLPLPYEPTISS